MTMRSGNTRRTSPRSCRTRRCCNRPCGLSPAPLPSIARPPRVAPSPEHVALIRAASASATSCAAERIAVRERAASSVRTISAAPRSRHASRRPAHSMLAATLAACRAALRRIAACSDPFAACWTLAGPLPWPLAALLPQAAPFAHSGPRLPYDASPFAPQASLAQR